jgi:hypothetical protein
MGGGTSKFDDTDWEKANGTFNGEALVDTIDGGLPTSRYQTYELQKNAYNQREFNVVDTMDKTLLFTTKAVPGTLAWFDVLGPTSCGDYKDLKLRVQVDLSRRTWIVYRYHTPVFQGQKPAKLPVRKGLDDTKDNPDENAKLYKTACITVSWSRYIAVVARYGPPSLEEFLVEDSSNTDSDDDDDDDKGDDTIRIPTASSDSRDDIFAQAQKIAARRRVGNPMDDDDDDDDDEEGDSKPSPSEQAKKLLSSAVSSLNPCTSSPTKKSHQSPESSQHDPSIFYTKKSPLHHPSSSAATAMPPSNNNKNAPSTSSRWPFSSIFAGASSSSSHPATTNSESSKLLTKEQKRRAAYETVLEGTIDLDGRLLECQEIYNKIIGTHQTSLVSKDRVVKLLQLDEAQHQATTTTTTTTPIQDDDDQEEEDDPFIQAVHQEKQQHPSDDETEDGWFSDQQKRLAWKYFGYESAEQAVQAKPTTPTNEFEASLQTIVQKSKVQQHQQQPKSPPPQRRMSWHEFTELAEQQPKSPMPTNEFEASLQTLFQEKQAVSPRTSWFGFGKGKCKVADSSSTTTKVKEVTESAREEILASCTLEQLQGDDEDDELNELFCPQSILSVKDKDNLPNLLDDEEIAPLAPSLAAQNGEAQTAETGDDSLEPIAAAADDDDANDPVASYSEEESSCGLTDEKNGSTEQEATEHGEDSSKLLKNGHASSAMSSLLSSSSSSVEEEPTDLKEPLVHGEEPSSTTTPSLPTEGKGATEQDKEPQQQPLVGYWTWKHTYTVHKMEMHLAKNSDLALHVVLAILVNQVRYERNALAMTV